jgi:copper/silver efflux system protein
MIEKIIEYSIRNRFLVLFGAAALTVAGVYAYLNTPVDAVPDLSENQVIVFTDWMGRSPREVEEQVTYPLSRKLQGLAGIKAVRSSSEFNFSMITLIFNDNFDFYFARQRVTERLDQARAVLPPGVVPYLAPDTTALGQIFFYTVEASPSHPLDPAKLWALNKFHIVPQLNSAAGVADVATVGGIPFEYQVDVRPDSLRTHGITLGDVYNAVARSNLAVGGGVIQKNNAEYLVRGVGWIKDKKDIENIVIKEVNGTPIYVKNVAAVQVGTQFRRGIFEKDGNEVAGGIVMMRHGENPLAVTRRIKEKIQELQSALPKGVRIVPAYDRTQLITGAIDTLTTVMWHEMVIASLAIFLILMHVRSVFVICVTLPLSVLFAFLQMWVLRTFGIIDVQSNIMSLAGITISIGVLVDQAIVMTENATHHLKEHFGDKKVTGDIRELVVAPCRTVGRPIFFSVLIMLISFIPVFMLSGREGKLFLPLALTKSLALLGVAIISVTVVPALIPIFIKGRLRREEDNWIVRSFINIYKPLLTWALPRRNFVMWMFAALLILAAGMFPLQAVIGQGASETAWKSTFLAVVALVTALTVILTRGLVWQVTAFVSLMVLSLWAYHFTKIGVSFMPALDEGTALDMPVTVPRVGVTESADDLKHRDGLLRGFPEVESVIGKAGRADTPTDPAPLDMFETIINFRPKALWPKRVLKYPDAVAQTRDVLRALEEKGFLLRSPDEEKRDDLVNDAAQKALTRFDESMRELALLRYREFERELGPLLTRYVVEDTVRRFDEAGVLHWPAKGVSKHDLVEALIRRGTADFGPWLAKKPALEDVTRLSGDVAHHLKDIGALTDVAGAFEVQENPLAALWSQTRELLGAEAKTFAGEVLDSVSDHRMELWRKRVKKVNWELLDRGVEFYTWYAIEELAEGASHIGLVTGAPRGSETELFIKESIKTQLGEGAAARARKKPSHSPAEDSESDNFDRVLFKPFADIRAEMAGPFKEGVFFWPRQGGPRGDLIDDEMGRVLQVPGWSNIFTQPIINRIEMLSTGVRTDIGIKVFGPDIVTIERVCKDIEAVVKPITGARDTLAAPIMGKGYLEIEIDREKAARYGITVEDIQNTIEIALGGRVVTYTVEKRDRFPVRLRYARVSRKDEEAVQRLLVSPSNMAAPAAMGIGKDGAAFSQMGGASGMPAAQQSSGGDTHQATPGHTTKGKPAIVLSAVAKVQIVEGPAMIKSENGRLLNYVTLNVRGRDMVGFVDEAKRVVAQKVQLPEGVHVEWSGEFEHQVRAARTLRFVFPVVIVLIFIILYLTYKDLADAGLMMLAVPEALAGGAFFMYLFPKIMSGWDTPPMDFSVAVWVGFIACFGMATETGIIMLVYLREAIDKRGGLENIKSLDELREAVIEGAVHRLRPKLLTEGVAIIAIFPMVFATGVGGEILAPMALPVLGGLLISDEVVDLFLPVRFYWVRRARWLKLQEKKAKGTAAVV